MWYLHHATPTPICILGHNHGLILDHVSARSRKRHCSLIARSHSQALRRCRPRPSGGANVPRLRPASLEATHEISGRGRAANKALSISEHPSLDCGAANRLQHLRCSVDDLRLHLTISSSASGARLTWLLEPCHHACFPRKHWMCTFCTDIGSWESPGTACESREICLRRQLRTPGRPRPSRCCRSP